MPTIHDEIRADLERRRAQGPDQERQGLYLMALEREQIVSVSYREPLLAARLAGLALPEDIRELMRHALLWAWKDEEMHAVYIRGLLLQGGRALAARAYLEQLAGAIGGWVSSVQQHFRFREAPLSRAVAAVLGLAGRLAGRVPREVRRLLRYGSFRDFCLGQVELEATAALVWDRLVELAPGPEGQDFARMARDERRHAAIFGAVAGALAEGDALAPGASAEALASAIAKVDEAFLPRARRRTLDAQNPLGRGGEVWCREGPPGAARAELRALLADLDLPGLLRERAAAQGKAPGQLTCAIKTSFMMGYDRRDPSPYVDPEVAAELALALRQAGCGRVLLLEAPNLFDWYFQRRSVAEVAAYLGYAEPAYQLADAGADQAPHRFFRGLAQSSVSRAWAEADVRVSLGKLRSHPVELVYLALANVEGLGHRMEAFVFAERQASRHAAAMMLLEDFPPHLGLLEGYEHAPDGIMGMFGARAPRSPRRLYGARDALALDLCAATDLGLPDPFRAPALREAVHWFGDPRPHLQRRGVTAPVSGWRSPLADDLSSLLSLLAYPVYAYASGRGALFVPEMDPAAFPPLRPPGPALRLGRAAVRGLLGM